tara:strand:- start:241 stop:384 length:144 start_codon:yes stop_codon:yes gene_type:complete
MTLTNNKKREQNFFDEPVPRSLFAKVGGQVEATFPHPTKPAKHLWYL